jgi:hypothetical protein
MRNQIAGLLLLLLLTACATTTTSNQNFAVKIEQSQTPQVVRLSRGDVKFDIEIVNNTAEAYTIEEIRLQSVGGTSYAIPPRTRVYKTRLAPGERQRLEFWTIAFVFSPAVDLPIAIRATIASKTDGGATRQDVYTQHMDGRIGIMEPFSSVARLHTPAASFVQFMNEMP